jgi:hypothetical protein
MPNEKHDNARRFMNTVKYLVTNKSWVVYIAMVWEYEVDPRYQWKNVSLHMETIT